jgi:hypothetical protein
MFDRKAHQFAYRMHSQLAHDIGTVGFRSLDSNPERDSNLFASVALCQKLNNFPLAPGKSVVGRPKMLLSDFDRQNS